MRDVGRRQPIGDDPDDATYRILVVVAHPDDAEYWIGGAVARWTAAGSEVRYLVLTDGDAGGFDPDMPRDDLPRVRREEQRRAAELLGVAAVQFLGIPEGGLLDRRQQVHVELVRTIRRTRPHLVVTWSPEWNWARFRSCHPDHLATGTLVLNAVYPAAGNRFALPFLHDDEGLQPWTTEQIWLINSPHVDHFVDITDTFDRKVAAVRAHASQSAHHQDLVSYLRGRLADNTQEAGLPEGRLAEAFHVVFNS